MEGGALSVIISLKTKSILASLKNLIWSSPKYFIIQRN